MTNETKREWKIALYSVLVGACVVGLVKGAVGLNNYNHTPVSAIQRKIEGDPNNYLVITYRDKRQHILQEKDGQYQNPQELNEFLNKRQEAKRNALEDKLKIEQENLKTQILGEKTK
jgi:hypothetical protein